MTNTSLTPTTYTFSTPRALNCSYALMYPGTCAEHVPVNAPGTPTNTFLPVMPANVNGFSASSSFTGTLTGSVEPAFASAALRSEVARLCAVFVAPARSEAMICLVVVVNAS